MEVRCAREGCRAEEDLLARRGHEMKKCAGCHILYYCSDACQREDWPRHWSNCRVAAGGGVQQDVGVDAAA